MKAFIVSILLFFSTHVFAQDGFDTFWSTFKDAIKKQDAKEIIGFCQFPIAGNIDNPESEEGYYEGEFIDDFSSFFDEATVSHIKNTNVEDLTYQDISDREINNLTFRNGYSLMVTYEDPEYGFESATIFTFAFVNNSWKLCRIDLAG